MLSKERIAELKIYFTRCVQSRSLSTVVHLAECGLELIEMVEALQTENEQLQALVARVREALREARETISAWDSWFECDRCKNMREAVATIDKAIGGKEDV